MVIQSTRALLDKLGIPDECLAARDGHDDFPEGVLAWHAHLFNVHGKKAVVFINNFTKYVLLFYKPMKADFADFTQHFFHALKTAFAAEGVRKEIIDAYLERAGSCCFSKTANKYYVSNMNEVCKQVRRYEELLDETTLIQNRISLKMGRDRQLYDGDLRYPNEELFRALCRLTGYHEDDWQSILAIPSYRVKIRIQLGKQDVWRQILMPAAMTLAGLHKVIEDVFGWYRRYPHEFQTWAGQPLGEDTKLQDIFTKTNHFLYTYDMNARWLHIITLEQEIPAGILRCPKLLDSHGERPPEGMGGEAAYLEYLQIMADPMHPRHRSLKRWAQVRRQVMLSQEDMNRKLQRYYLL